MGMLCDRDLGVSSVSFKTHGTQTLLKDPFGRTFSYLRFSVTQMCNFQCSYCLPNGFQKDLNAPNDLSLEEIEHLMRAFYALGIKKVRLTGGEPTARKDLLEIVRILKQKIHIPLLALTTNGLLFRKQARDLFQAGLRQVNFSLDSFLKERFQWLTQRNVFDEVKAAILEAIEIGYQVKINAVLLKGVNDDPTSLCAFFDFVREHPVSIRFIELMQTGNHFKFFKRYHQKASFLKKTLIQKGWVSVSKTHQNHLSGPAQVFKHAQYLGTIGVIAPYEKDFCTSCNRLRISSKGALHLCLFGETSYDLRPWLKNHIPPLALENFILRLLNKKPQSHQLAKGKTGAISYLASVGG